MNDLELNTADTQQVISGRMALAGCSSYQFQTVLESVDRLIDLLGGIRRFVQSGDRVLVKPNFICTADTGGPAQTHPAVILAIVRRLHESGARVTVGDSPAWQDARACAASLGLLDELEKLGIPLIQLNQPVRTRIDGSLIGISRHVLEADKIINVPKFKTHQQIGATFAVKNLYGCVAGKEKAYRHFTRGHDPELFCRMLLGIAARVAPVLHIIDAVTAMEGPGPIHGTARHLNVLIGGDDPIACERVCCELIGMNPESLPILRTAQRLHLWNCDEPLPEIAGDRLEQFRCETFQLAEPIPLRFTFPRICKSIAKQIILLALSPFRSGHKKGA